MVRATTTIETLAMFLEKWATRTNGYVQLTVYPKVCAYCEADVYRIPQNEHTYFEGSIDQVLHEVDALLE